jgi:endonuclease/exonuclease/phosphatase (EEP) superfamily protein YafD
MCRSFSRSTSYGATLESRINSLVSSYPDIDGPELVAIVERAFELAYEQFQERDLQVADRIAEQRE